MAIFAPMEKLIRHIETLLRRHDYVIVPGVGGFVLQKQSSVITSEGIEPPLTTVSFNPLMKTSDGLLAIELSRAEQISFREAVQLIGNEAESAITNLESGKKLELGNLGILSSGNDGKIIFTPSAYSYFIPSNFGLSKLHISAVEKSTGEEKRVIRIVIPQRRQIIRYTAVAAIAAGLIFGIPRISETYHNNANLNPVSIIENLEVPSGNQQTQPAEIAVTERQATIAVPEASHHVIVSCMATQKDAEEYQARLKALNYQNTRILPPVKTYRIAIESFTTKEEAIIYMQQLRKNNPQFADAWVLSE